MAVPSNGAKTLPQTNRPHVSATHASAASWKEESKGHTPSLYQSPFTVHRPPPTVHRPPSTRPPQRLSTPSLSSLPQDPRNGLAAPEASEPINTVVCGVLRRHPISSNQAVTAVGIRTSTHAVSAWGKAV